MDMVNSCMDNFARQRQTICLSLMKAYNSTMKTESGKIFHINEDNTEKQI